MQIRFSNLTSFNDRADAWDETYDTAVIEGSVIYHYTNMPMQYTATFHCCKNVNFQMEIFNIFLI